MDIEAQDKRRGESRTGWLLVLVCIICHKLSICDRIWEKKLVSKIINYREYENANGKEVPDWLRIRSTASLLEVKGKKAIKKIISGLSR